jgi:hypothetical protein
MGASLEKITDQVFSLKAEGHKTSQKSTIQAIQDLLGFPACRSGRAGGGGAVAGTAGFRGLTLDVRSNNR